MKSSDNEKDQVQTIECTYAEWAAGSANLVVHWRIGWFTHFKISQVPADKVKDFEGLHAFSITAAAAEYKPVCQHARTSYERSRDTLMCLDCGEDIYS